MTNAAQSLVVTLVGAFILKVCWEGAHVRYVKDWFFWPLVVCGVLLLVIAAVTTYRTTQDREDPHQHRVPHTTWLMLLPVMVAFAISPPPLGSFVAERSGNRALPSVDASAIAPLPEGDPVPLSIDEFLLYADVDGEGTLDGRRVEITGFVSHQGEGWAISQITMGCCAADAYALNLDVIADGPRPARDTWLQVVGTWAPDPTAGPENPFPHHKLTLESMTEIEPPANPYDY